MDLGAPTSYKHCANIVDKINECVYIGPLESGIFDNWDLRLPTFYVSPIHRECFALEYSEH